MGGSAKLSKHCGSRLNINAKNACRHTVTLRSVLLKAPIYPLLLSLNFSIYNYPTDS